jgi:uncharacterized protein
VRNKVLIGVGAAVIIIMAVLTGCAANAGGGQPITVNTVSQQTGIWVSGEGKVSATPNLATIYIGVSAQSEKVADAQSQAATAMDKVMAALTGNGVDKKDIQTSEFTIQQVTKWDDKSQEQIIVGYSVTNTVLVKIRALDKVGTIVDDAVTAGGDLIRINSINFSVEDPTNYYKQARDLAMQKAKDKAAQIAADAGVTLDKPIYISENSYYPVATPANYYKADMAGGAQASTSISPGQLDITLDVQVAYGIK